MVGIQSRQRERSRRCPICQEPFLTLHHAKMYCSGPCKREGENVRRRARHGKLVECPHCHIEFPVALVWSGRGGCR